MFFKLQSRRIPRRLRSPGVRTAATVVEFAAVAPVMFLFIFGAIEFTRFMMVSSLAEDAAYEAARHVIVPGAIVSEAQTVATNILQSMKVTPMSTVVAPYEGTTLRTQIDDDTTEVRVTVNIRVSDMAILAPKFIAGNKTISKTARVKAERYVGYYDGT